MYLSLHVTGSGAAFACIIALALFSSLSVDGFLNLPHGALNFRIKGPANRNLITNSVRVVRSARPLFLVPPVMDRKLHATEDDEDGLTGVEVLTPHEFDPNSEDDLKYQDEMALDKTTESKMLRILAKGVVPLSTSVGFALVPSSNMALRLAGAAAGGLAGLVSRSSLLKRVERMKDLCESERPQTDITPMNVYDEVLHGVDRRNVVLRRLAEGIIPAAIFTGFAAIPSNNIALRLLGAAVGWVGGIVTEDRAQQLLIKSDKDRFNSEVAVSEVPQTVQDALDALHEVRTPWTELTCADLCAIARQHRVNPRHIDVFLSLAAGEVIFAAVQVDGLDLFQNLAGVLSFAGNGGMPYAAIAHGLAFAGFKVSDQLEPSTDGTAIHNDDFDPEVLAQAAKVLFLSEHLLAKKKGYLEGKIVPALASFPPEMYKLYLTADTTALFEEVCRLAFIEHEEFDDDTVPAYMEFLTVSREVSGFQPSDMYDTIRQAVLTELAENLPESSPPLEANFTDFHRLEQGCKALGIVGQDFNYTVIRHTQSFFDDAAQVLVQAVVDRPESAPHMQAKLLERLATLKIDLHSAGQTLRRLTQAQNEIFQERIGNLYRVADPGTKEATASRALVAYAHIFEALQYLAAPFTGDKPLTPPQLPFDAATRAHILQAKAKMTGDTMAVSEVETQILELKDGAGHFVHQSLAIAKTRKFILDSIRADKFNPDAKQMYMSKLSECGVSGSAWQATALNIFHDEMTRVAARPVPTQQEMDRLDRVRDFLDISADDARTVYLDKLGEKYCKAVEESLTAEGGISMEYAFGLQRLRTRLNITLDDAKLLFYLETKKHFGPVVKGIIDAWKAETDGSYQRQNAQQPPKVFMREVMNMLDLRDQICRLMDCEGGLEEELHVTGTGLATSEESVELFKHFLLHRISEQDPELRQRYVDRSPQLANFLEITPEDQDDIRRSLSFSTYRRLLTNALRAHDEVPQTLIQQFAYLKQGLQLTDEEAEIIYAEATKKAIADNAEELLDASEKGQRFSAASAKRIRQQVASLGMSLKDDLKFPDITLALMYALEVQEMVETSREAEFAEVQHTYGLDDQAADAVIESTCRRYMTQLVNKALQATKDFKEHDALQLLKRMLRYAKFVTTGTVEADGGNFGEADKSSLIAVYANEARAGTDPEIRALEAQGDQTQRLRELIELDPFYYVPYETAEIVGNDLTDAWGE